MKYELSLDQLHEIAQCIVHLEMSDDEACDYVRDVAEEMCSIELVEAEPRITATLPEGDLNHDAAIGSVYAIRIESNNSVEYVNMEVKSAAGGVVRLVEVLGHE